MADSRQRASFSRAEMTVDSSTAIGVIEEVFGFYDPMPFELTPDLFIDFAMSQFQSRMDRLESCFAGERNSA